MNIVVLGAGTAGLVTSLMIREKYPSATITIVKSGEIGIVGVGEGSTEQWAQFMDFVGIDVLELLYETRATVKIGILFKGWGSNSEYVHSVTGFNLSALNRPEIYNHLYLSNDSKIFPLTPGFKDIYYKNLVPLTPGFRPSNQYHFDTFKLGEYLIKKCTERSINVIDAKVFDATLDSRGYIQELITDKENIVGDLFIDCSGFKRVLSSKLNNKWVSKSRYLPLNRAIAFPTEFDTPDDIEPYTTSTALSAGWAWKIPTRDRYGNGYVFNTNYTDSDKALGELSCLLGKKVEKFARDIPFEAGKIDKFWLNNVISVGLSGSFAEPLEAQSIGFTILQAKALINYLDSWPYNNNVSNKFNNEMDEIFNNIVDYLQLHYLGDRRDSKFWQDKPFELTDFIKENLPLFKRGIIEPSLFKTDFMFQTANWYQVLAGLNLIDKGLLRKNLDYNRQTYNSLFAKQAEDALVNIRYSSICTHREYLNITRDNLMFRKRLNES
tara:strand:+ start:3303 stop:4787 length:1485 start_codon:yes stop_codon:yes gene_type:complete